MEPITWQSQKLDGPERALIIHPKGQTKGLPILYLLHGQYDDESDWLNEQKGRLLTLLSESCCIPILIVLPYVGAPKQSEPTLKEVTDRLRDVKKSVEKQFAPDARQGILGISMGGKQALAFTMKEPANAGFSVFGILSGKFQGTNLDQVRQYVNGNDSNQWQKSLGSNLSLYFHYCGSGNDVPRGEKRPLTGDKRYLAGNQAVANQLGGGKIEIGPNGLHNWNFWRPQLQKFFEEVSNLWQQPSTHAPAR